MLLAAGTAMLAAPPQLAWLIPLALLAATLSEGCSVAVFWSIHHLRQPQSREHGLARAPTDAPAVPSRCAPIDDARRACARAPPERAVQSSAATPTVRPTCRIGSRSHAARALLHRAVAAYSIALVNSFGNLGGFAGTYVLGYLHDVFAASDAASAPRGVVSAARVSDWGWGTVVVGAAFVGCTALTGLRLREGASPSVSRYFKF